MLGQALNGDDVLPLQGEGDARRASGGVRWGSVQWCMSDHCAPSVPAGAGPPSPGRGRRGSMLGQALNGDDVLPLQGEGDARRASGGVRWGSAPWCMSGHRTPSVMLRVPPSPFGRRVWAVLATFGNQRHSCRVANEIARSLRRRMTRQEVRVWLHLRALREQGLHFRRQAPIAGYIADFACLRARLVVEIDGGQHGMPSRQALDVERTLVMNTLGYEVLRFWNVEVDTTVDAVIDTIYHRANERLRTLCKSSL